MRMHPQTLSRRPRPISAIALALGALAYATAAPAQEATKATPPANAPAPAPKPTALKPGVPAEKTPNVTTDTGKPVGTDEHSMNAAGGDSPTLLQHFYLLEKIARFDRERIPERVVHARGAGVHGDFICHKDCSAFTRAAFLAAEGKATPVFVRFSTVVLPKGSADTARGRPGLRGEVLHRGGEL